ncbi:hypothetical protein FRB99_002174 [Tulasnella sp. 403]|nr:hypothetical protein FRB99_002174 [Tulasnella sp. 403]
MSWLYHCVPLLRAEGRAIRFWNTILNNPQLASYVHSYEWVAFHLRHSPPNNDVEAPRLVSRYTTAAKMEAEALKAMVNLSSLTLYTTVGGALVDVLQVLLSATFQLERLAMIIEFPDTAKHNDAILQFIRKHSSLQHLDIPSSITGWRVDDLPDLQTLSCDVIGGNAILPSCPVAPTTLRVWRMSTDRVISLVVPSISEPLKVTGLQARLVGEQGKLTPQLLQSLGALFQAFPNLHKLELECEKLDNTSDHVLLEDMPAQFDPLIRLEHLQLIGEGRLELIRDDLEKQLVEAYGWACPSLRSFSSNQENEWHRDSAGKPWCRKQKLVQRMRLIGGMPFQLYPRTSYSA